MAPRPSGRRRSRERDPGQPNSRANLINFQKPNLPLLQGTPSSRRQYAYGSGVEPMPAQPGRQGRSNDLAAAVHGAIERHNQDPMDDEDPVDEEETESETESRQRQQSQSTSSEEEEEEEDELARSEADYKPEKFLNQRKTVPTESRPAIAVEPLHPALNHRGWTPEGSEFDDVRSFDMEDDYYGDATIDTPPRTLFPPLSTFSVGKSPLREQLTEKPLLPDAPEKLPLNPETQVEPQNGSTTAPLSKTFKPLAKQPEVTDANHENRRVTRDDARHGASGISTHMGLADEPVAAPKRSWNPVKSLLGGRNLAPVSPPESETQSSLEPGAVKIVPQTLPTKPILKDRPVKISSNVSKPTENETPNSRRWLSITPGSIRSSLFSRYQPPLGEQGPDLTSLHYRSDHSEMDDAIQRTIGEVEDEAERQMQQGADVDPRRGRWRQRWAAIPSLLPWGRSQSPDSFEDDMDSNDSDAMDLWQLLNPLTYLQAALWFFCNILDQIIDFLSGIFTESVQRRLALLGGTLVNVIGGILTVLLALLLTRVAYTNLPSDKPHLGGIVGMPSWSSFKGITSRVGEILPSISWSSRNVWDDFPGLENLGDAQYAEFEEWIKKILRELSLIKEAGKLHDGSIQKLESIVPKLVHMNLKDGKPVVTQEFWHAIRDLIRQDDGFLSFNKQGSNYQASHEKQWKSLISRLTKDPAFASKLNLSVGDMETKLANKMPYFWDAWVNNNRRKVTQLLGSAVEKSQLAGSPADFDKRLEQMVKKQLGTNKAGDTIVTRDEFLRHMKNEFAAHRSEIKAEMNELQPKLEQLVRESVQLAKDDGSAGVTRPEVTKLVDQVVRKAMADANLEAMAKGRILSYWDKDLKNQVNYFGVGAGAIIDARHTSKIFQPDDKYINDKGLKGLMKYNAIEAILPWHDDGDCWCAARSVNKRGNPHGALLAVIMGHTVIPQHIVVEHILPGATTNPGARPRQIEVYASIEDKVVRERVLDFAAAHFPDDESDWNFMPPDLPERFVKISQFVYESAELHDGVQVHRLSSELVALNAETDHVVIRAVSNYGAENHTCFYRVRLYGHRTDQAK